MAWVYTAVQKGEESYAEEGQAAEGFELEGVPSGWRGALHAWTVPHYPRALPAVLLPH